MRWSIRYQFLLPLLALVLVVMISSGWAALATARHTHHQIEDQVRQIVQTLHHAGFPLTENVLVLMKGFSGADYVVVDAEGQLFSTLPDLKTPPRAPTIRSEAWAKLTLATPMTLQQTAYLASGVELTQGRNAGATLYILYPESLWNDVLWEAFRPSLLFGVGGGLAALLGTVVLAQRWTRRIQELERRTRLIAGGDFSPMALPRRNDELRDLASSVNDMAQRLAEYQESMRKSERLRLLGQVSGGLAHQLRNGVTGARLAVQVHARECSSVDAESLQVALRQLALVELHLKRFLDQGRSGEMERKPCPLPQLLDETLALLRPQCRHASIEVDWQPPAEMTRPVVLGDAGQLQHLFLNVASNAIEAAGPGGKVEVRLTEQLGCVRIEVRDSGPGPAPQLAGKLFEPFVTGKSEGVGLGLAVARQVAEAHGGSIHWQRSDGQTCFAVELPVAEE